MSVRDKQIEKGHSEAPIPKAAWQLIEKEKQEVAECSKQGSKVSASETMPIIAELYLSVQRLTKEERTGGSWIHRARQLNYL